MFEQDIRTAAIIDLSSFDVSYEIRSWKPGPAPTPPSRLFVPPDGLDIFTRRVESRGARCLVVAYERARTWWSPDYGWVRHADTDRITRELVFAELPD